MVTQTEKELDQTARQIRILESILTVLKRRPRRSDTDSLPGTLPQFIVRVKEVVTAGTPVQGDDIPIPPGYTCVVRQRRHAGTPVGYVSGSRSAVGTNLERAELRDGESVGVEVSNMKYIWLNANTNNTFFEFIVEQ